MVAPENKTYRRSLSNHSGLNRRLIKLVWHVDASCPQWPEAEFIEHSEPPGYGMICADCIALGNAHRENAEFSFFTVPGDGIDGAKILWKWKRGEEVCLERCTSLAGCMERAERFGFQP